MFENLIDRYKKFKTNVIKHIIWAEKKMAGKTGEEKKKIVAEQLDLLVQLPEFLEWADDIFIWWVIDRACKQINEVIGHDFGEKEITDPEIEKIADSIEEKPENLKELVEENEN